jgi:hypothetical protein
VALPALLDRVRAGRLDLASSLGAAFSLDDVNAAVETSLAGEAGRVLVIPCASVFGVARLRERFGECLHDLFLQP